MMTHPNPFPAATVKWASLAKHLVIGGGIGFVLISLFLLPVDEPRPEWPELWWVRPIAVVTLAGALGAMFHFITQPLMRKGMAMKILFSFLSLVVYVVALWLGTVLGLVGTLWN